MTVYTIEQVEAAINYWRVHDATGEDAALCASARVLADVYGLMIYHHASSVSAGTFTAEQLRAVEVGLTQAAQSSGH
ncbi:hypothetical protein ASG35_11840 [Burkholderia sp. Leaf177]|uniref:DUF3717 domain-containing protein n=1 Tax=Burkholderia sp. Leaf177 TaxID=1736287 RepID=UPI0006FCA062|nr:DUF3717 domain-containing protein [Burkholderia sp. Leaf177]KQR76969.1 hypothetical protein ASG35_11840 [Burkholderia sp. Leaf177]